MDPTNKDRKDELKRKEKYSENLINEKNIGKKKRKSTENFKKKYQNITANENLAFKESTVISHIDMKSKQVKLSILFVLTMVNILLVIIFYDIVRYAVTMFLIFPITIISWLWGKKIGFITLIFNFILNSFILFLIMWPNVSEYLLIFTLPMFISGHIAVVFLCVVVGTFHDLNIKIKESEQNLKKSEEKYRDLFENSPNSIMMLNMKGEIIDINIGIKKLVGYNKEDLIGKTFLNLPILLSKDLPLIKENAKIISKGENPDPIVVQIKNKDNTLIWVKIQTSLVKLGKEVLVHLIFQDFTKQRQSEQEIKKLEKILQEIDALTETAPLGIFLLNQKGEILKANMEAENVLKISRDELIKFSIYDFFNSESLDRVKKHYESDIYDLKIPNKIEALVRTKHGNLFYIEIASTILRIGDHIIIHSYFSDITERKNFEKNRELLFDQLLASLEFKSKFMAAMSHELRTPLNAIIGFSQLLLDDSYGDLNFDQKDFLDDISSAGDHLLSLIDSILDISKIEAGKLKLDMQKFDLNELIVEINAVIKPLYSNKNLEFKVKGINKYDYLIADPVRFKQILYNILSNAFKFTEKGNVSLRGIQRIDHWEFQIKDTGVGIAKKDYDVVFREFGRVEGDKIKQVQGTGLGLALTKRLVNLHGGEIWFESKLNKGTTFFFTIPKITLTEEKL